MALYFRYRSAFAPRLMIKDGGIFGRAGRAAALLTCNSAAFSRRRFSRLRGILVGAGCA